MITVGMNYQVISGKEKVFENAFRKVVQTMGEDPGHSVTQMYRNIDDEASYLITSDWNSREAFNEFIASDKFKKVTNWGSEQILAGRPKHEVYEK